MISGATRGAGGKALGRHNSNAETNEAVYAGISQGLISEGIENQIAELTRLGSHARTNQPLYHLHIDPMEGSEYTREQRDRFRNLFLQEFGLKRQPFATQIHIKNGREHEHLVALRCRADGTAIRMDNDYQRREKIARIIEFEFGLPFTKGAHNRSVIHALEKERPEIAAAMKAAGLDKGPRPRAEITPKERAQQERTFVSKADISTATAKAWAASDGVQAFAAALQEQGLRLAIGDKCPVILDQSGNTHSLTRMLAMAAKATGTTAPQAAEIKQRLKGIDLPNVEQAKQSMIAARAAIIQQADLQPEPPPGIQAMSSPPLPGENVPAGPLEALPVKAEMLPSRDGQQSIPTQQEGHPSEGKTGPQSSSSTGSPSHTAPEQRGAVHGGTDGDPTAGIDIPAAGDLLGWIKYRERVAQKAQQIAEAAARRGTPAPQEQKSGGTHVSHAQAGVEADANKTTREAVQRIIDGINRAFASKQYEAEISNASEQFRADCSAIERGCQPAAGGSPQEPCGDNREDAREHWRSLGPTSGPDQPTEIGGAQPNHGNPDNADRNFRVPDTNRAAARKNIESLATTRRLEQGLAAHANALARLRQTRQELDPEYRARRNAHQRINADRERIACILRTHPHPYPADLDPTARATLYAGRLSDRLRAGEVISPDDFKMARADGAAHAYAAQKDVARWQARPDVLRAVEDDRLNRLAHSAACTGDKETGDALRAGDPEAAREIIRRREMLEKQRLRNMDILHDLDGGPSGPKR